MKYFKTLEQVEKKINSIDTNFRKYSTKAKKIDEFFRHRQWNGTDKFYVSAHYNADFFDCVITIFNQTGHTVKHYPI